ncbi:MAG: isopentenyl-diphosphate delta-isomerase [Marine Group III euryarchaeote CG-Epi4]|uniref:isopentenyl-diphosphate Delta-isomerase n=1 Tax=Marine Group III euryarchaeote CG-Epi4 TaxID=1888998 RepID=A0A1J5TKI8_9ARCH|nr:MAG: isopentenyl-diphosphate delta-isomerase [Marine Group III euryarchaeote CG-Epi4]|tara:strand:+ start:309 stop:989 length:681 start_codon:yes stop_codon:yes gene_type:complete
MIVENSELQGYDEAQKEMMDENCIIVDKNDHIVGRDSKVNCHLNEGKLHRAFSVLIFDSADRLLIQQRANEKITFPSIWANSCCSHPLYQNGEEEDVKGAKKAAVRKLTQELGILPSEIQSEDLNFITKMHYKARADQKWIEHEVDYIFALKKDVKIDPNPNEIQRTKYVDVKELNELFEKSNDNGVEIGPWFRLIRDNFLNEIWKSLDSLDAISDNKVHHMGEVK